MSCLCSEQGTATAKYVEVDELIREILIDIAWFHSTLLYILKIRAINTLTTAAKYYITIANTAVTHLQILHIVV